MSSIALPIFLFSHNDAGHIQQCLASLDEAIRHATWTYVPAGASAGGDGPRALMVPVVHVLANGCRDDTAARARAFSPAGESPVSYHVHELERGDKGDAWNYAVQRILPDLPNAPVALFLDSDVDLGETDLPELARYLLAHPEVQATVSEPRKRKRPFSLRHPIAFVLSRGGQDHSNGKICGQLYALKTAIARRVRLPQGLLVEDGFIAACVVTELFSHAPDGSLVVAHPSVHHYFEAEATFAGAIRHEARLELGTHVNMVAWPLLWEKGSGADSFLEQKYAEDPEWLLRAFHDHFAAKGLRAFYWRRAVEPLFQLRLRPRLPIDIVVALLRAAQRSLSLARAFREARSGRLRW